MVITTFYATYICFEVVYEKVYCLHLEIVGNLEIAL